MRDAVTYTERLKPWQPTGGGGGGEGGGGVDQRTIACARFAFSADNTLPALGQRCQ